MSIDKLNKIEILENAISYIVAFGMLIYGVAKMVQFNGAINTQKTLPELTPQQLMWAFYGYSKPYVIILGFIEIIGALLIFIKKTRLIGCLLLSVILCNVILQDFFFDVSAITVALFYQFLILLVFWINQEKIRLAFQNLLISNVGKVSIKTIIITVILFVFLRILEYFLTVYLF